MQEQFMRKQINCGNDHQLTPGRGRGSQGEQGVIDVSEQHLSDSLMRLCSILMRPHYIPPI